jgi:hypothetical protein
MASFVGGGTYEEKWALAYDLMWPSLAWLKKKMVYTWSTCKILRVSDDDSRESSSYNHYETVTTHNFQYKDGNIFGFGTRKRSPFENRINKNKLDRKVVRSLQIGLDLEVWTENLSISMTSSHWKRNPGRTGERYWDLWSSMLDLELERWSLRLRSSTRTIADMTRTKKEKSFRCLQTSLELEYREHTVQWNILLRICSWQ